MSERTSTMTPGRANGSPVPGGGSVASRRHRRSEPTGVPHRPAQLTVPRRRVRVPELIGGVFIVSASVLGILVWSKSTSATTPIVVLARDMKRGEVLSEADFVAAEVRSDGVRLLSFDRRAKMVGRVAAIDLPAATPLTDAVAVEVLPVGDGEALVGRSLEIGQFPAGLSMGANVRVVVITGKDGVVAPAADATAATPVQTVNATVEDIVVGAGAADAAQVTLRLSNDVADAVAAAEGVRLVQVKG